MFLPMHTDSAPMNLAASASNQIHVVDKDQPIQNLRTMEQVLAESVAQRRFNMFLLSLFAMLALIIAIVGVYGVISYSVSHRTHEFGIRMALGAQPRDLIKLVLSQGMRLAVIGIIIGLFAAFALTRAPACSTA